MSSKEELSARAKKEELGERIRHSFEEWQANRERLTGKKPTLDEFAAECGWMRGGKQRIEHYISGTRTPKPWDLPTIARVLEKSPAWLAFGEDSGVKLAAEELKLLDDFRRVDDAYKASAAKLLSEAPDAARPASSATPKRPNASAEPIVLKTAPTKPEANNRRT